jgi:hypothetical protein
MTTAGAVSLGLRAAIAVGGMMIRSAWMFPIAVAGIAIAAPGACGSQGDDGARPAAAKSGALLPRPPRQDEPWTPPGSGLPAAVVDAARALFEQGLADPRGCGYREVVLAGGTWPLRNDATPRPPAHAWALPFDVTGGPRYAVAWNGLVYPVARLGPAADLEADVQALVRPQPAPGIGVVAGAAHHLVTASETSLTPTKAILLLRLGRGDLAEAVWKAGPGGLPAANGGGRPDGRVLYARLAADWAWALYERAASAHASGDDPLALASLRELARIRPLIEARAGVVKAPPIGGPRNRFGIPGRPSDFDFIAQLPEFLADQERRAREPKRVPAPKATSPDRAARIAALIRDFDQVHQEPFFFPGAADLAADAIVQAVIKEGDAAVEPLLDCLEHDNRLTRTVDRDDRHGTRYLHVQRAAAAAYAALIAIMGTRQLGAMRQDPGGALRGPTRAELAAEIRDFWRKNRGLGPAERLFRTLADDEATREQWLDAAEALAQPNDVRGRGGSYVIPYRFGGKVPPPRGEPLRSRANPSITELMARRTRDLVARPGHPDPGFIARDANRMAGFLADWDLKGALPTLKERVARSGEVLRLAQPNDNAVYGLDVEIARFTMLRVQGGDPAALADYAAWIRTIRKPDPSGYSQPEMFEPMWTYPDDPAIAAAAIALFDNDTSPLVPLFGPEDRGWGELGTWSDVIVSPMLGVAPFRKLVLAGLADDRPLGSVTCDAAGKVTIVVDKGLSMLPTFRDDDPNRPRPGTSMPLRLSDHYAWKLQELAGIPRFRLHWPKDRRDRAIAEVVAALTHYGERFRTTEVSRALYEGAPFHPRHIRAVMVFPPLDRPATAADIAAGRAIFAAPPGAEARPWPLPARPMAAHWTTMEVPADELSLRPYDDRPRERAAMMENFRRGLVWQAEEIREGGRWRRHYGFMGRHVLARVAAEEMDFPAPWNTGWTATWRDLDGRLVPPGGRDDGRLILTEPVPVGGPLPIVATLRNHRGIAVSIPSELARAGGDLSLRSGVSIRVYREPDPVRRDPVAGVSGAVPQSAEWPELAPRRQPARFRSDASRALEPAATAEALRLDLRDLFVLDRPGRYRVEIAFDDIRAEDGRPARISADFTAKPAEGRPVP